MMKMLTAYFEDLIERFPKFDELDVAFLMNDAINSMSGR